MRPRRCISTMRGKLTWKDNLPDDLSVLIPDKHAYALADNVGSDNRCWCGRLVWGRDLLDNAAGKRELDYALAALVLEDLRKYLKAGALMTHNAPVSQPILVLETLKTPWEDVPPLPADLIDTLEAIFAERGDVLLYQRDGEWCKVCREQMPRLAIRSEDHG